MTTENETIDLPQITATIIGVELLPASMLPELPELPVEMEGQTKTLGNNLDALQRYGTRQQARCVRGLSIIDLLVRDGWTGTVGPRHVLLMGNCSRDEAKARLATLNIGDDEVQWLPTDGQIAQGVETGGV